MYLNCGMALFSHLLHFCFLSRKCKLLNMPNYLEDKVTALGGFAYEEMCKMKKMDNKYILTFALYTPYFR